uniref:Uncharacterized protein n=1 Tax=Mycena chlorophos TaxID=658473 RepID=A0ABQ0M1X7_MYCCL|nr:predicted protein [Mycena chlorophos]
MQRKTKNMYAPYAQQQQYAQYSTTIYQERLLYPPPLSHNPHGDIPIVPQPIMHRLPGPIPAERLEPPSGSHHSNHGEHRSKSRSRSRTSSTHSSNRAPVQAVVPPVPVLPPLYGPPRTQYQPEPEAYVAEATTVGAYNQPGYLASSNEQLAAQYDVDAEATDTPIPGGLRRCREALEQEERERRRQKKRANRRSRSVGDFAEYRPQPAAIYSNPSAARSNASIASSKSSKSRSKSSKHHHPRDHHLPPPVPALPRMRSRQNLVIPSPLKLTRSNGKTETTNTFSAGMQVEHLASPYRQPAAAPMDPWGFDEHPELGARPYKPGPSIYGNPRLAASSGSLYAPSRAPQYENMPPVPPVPVEYYHEKRGGFFKRLVGLS